MPTSPTDPAESGALLRLADGRELIVVPGAGTALAVPGTQVAIHWLDLAGDLTPAQAAAAARLMLADASADPLGELHVAAGRPEKGLTPIALAPIAWMQEWVAGDPDLIVPESLLLAPPAEGLVRRGLDHRGLAAAFSVEPGLAELVIGDAPVEEIGEEAFEAGLAAALADPVLNLRQGAFARRRHWKVDRSNLRRVALLAAALALVSLVLQLATILRYKFDTDRLEAEAAALGGPATAASRPGFGALAPLLFEAVRSTPNLELTRLEYRPDGSLGATLSVDSPATLAAFRARAEASGLSVEGGSLTSAGGRPSAELVLRPA
ncbi:MAG TPA: type II secretion system protein GspL [Allosphingosinicella sp.]|nr:type II secretion system protein GspL [Allosphingosinicella sp.]